MVRKQLHNTLQDEVRVWVTERKPKSTKEAGQLAENYLQATQGTNASKPVKNERQPPGICSRCKKLGYRAKHCPYQKQSTNGTRSQATRTDREGRDGPICYTCHNIAVNCPSKTTLHCDRGDAGKRSVLPNKVYRHSKVNSTPVEDLLLDTGTARTLVRSNLVPPSCLVDGEVTTLCPW